MGAGASTVSPSDYTKRDLADMDSKEVCDWLRTQHLPASMPFDKIREKFIANQVNGITLSMITCRELRDDIGIIPLGWRKAILRIIKQRLAAEISAARNRIEDKNEANRTFSFRKESHRLEPLPKSGPSSPEDDRPDMYDEDLVICTALNFDETVSPSAGKKRSSSGSLLSRLSLSSLKSPNTEKRRSTEKPRLRSSFDAGLLMLHRPRKSSAAVNKDSLSPSSSPRQSDSSFFAALSPRGSGRSRLQTWRRDRNQRRHQQKRTGSTKLSFLFFSGFLSPSTSNSRKRESTSSASSSTSSPREDQTKKKGQYSDKTNE